MTRKRLTPPASAQDAASTLGQHIRIARAHRHLTAADVGARAGVSARTVTAIERGDPAVSIGNVFTVATVVGVPLFGADTPAQLHQLRRTGQDHLALLPTRVYSPITDRELDDNVDLNF